MSVDIKLLRENFDLEYKKNLAHKGVKMPSASQIGPLLCLYHNKGIGVSQAMISKWCADHGFPDYNKQIRHMATYGWYLSTGNRRTSNMLYDSSLKREEICLVSMKMPNPKKTADRSALINNSDFLDLIHHFEKHRGGCAVCGRISRHEDGSPNYDKGHISRNKSATLGNVAPICPPCNNKMQRDNLEWYLDNDLVCSPSAFRGQNALDHLHSAINLMKKQGLSKEKILTQITTALSKE